jgi:2'-5' RNA ligase
MRLFVAIDIDDTIRANILRFVEGVQGLAPDARWVQPQSLHITLKFIGETPEQAITPMKDALGSIRDSAFEMAFRGFGFFPSSRAARVFWIGIEAGAELHRLASGVDSALGRLGIAKEEHAYQPHLTLARRGSAAPRRGRNERSDTAFERLREKLTAAPDPDFGTMRVEEFFLYRSQLSPGGSKYTKMAKFEFARA